MQTVPLQAIPNQSVIVTLNDQNCQLNVYQKSTGLFVDIYLADTLILGGVIARNQCLMIMNTYFGFLGDFMFIDNEGTCDPWYDGLASRFSLIYLFPSDFPTLSLYL